MSKIAFRFDIDSHKCMRDGVPILLDLSQKYNVPFTFFMNLGQAIDLLDSMLQLLFRSNELEDIYMLSAKEKLGIKDYLYAAFFNPKMIKYKSILDRMISSSSEIGIHGGKNHSKWYSAADKWDYNKIIKELQWSIATICSLFPEYQPCGFAAPGFVTNELIEKGLKEVGFKYSSNIHNLGAENVVIRSDGYLPQLVVNLCGEPGGIAYWEYCQAKKMDDLEVLEDFMDFVDNHDKCIVFDHPYFVAVQKSQLLDQILRELKSKGHSVVTLYELSEIE